MDLSVRINIKLTPVKYREKDNKRETYLPLSSLDISLSTPRARTHLAGVPLRVFRGEIPDNLHAKLRFR